MVAWIVGMAASPVTAKDGEKTLRARAVVRGGLNNSSIIGEVIFTQRSCPGCPTPGLTAPATDPGFKNFPEPTVTIVARIQGLTAEMAPGAHGMHIHENGVCTPGDSFASAGSHFDPGPFSSAGSQVDANHPFHMGDIPNLFVKKSGEGFLRHHTSRITLSPGPLSVFDANGSAVILHLNPDRGITGAVGASGGSRVACGVIEMLSDDDADGYSYVDFDDDGDREH
jgi:superoxide dismutase, Cu-Zn family